MAEETLPEAIDLWARLIQSVIYNLSVPKGKLVQKTLLFMKIPLWPYFDYER